MLSLKRALSSAVFLLALACTGLPTNVFAAAGEIQATMRTEAGDPFAGATVEVSCDASTYAVLGITDDAGAVSGNPTTGTTCEDGSGLQFRVSSSTIPTQLFPITGYTLLPYYARVDYADPVTAVSGSTNNFRIGLDTTSTYAMSVWNAAGDASVLPFPTGVADHTFTATNLAFNWGNDVSPYLGINPNDWFVEATKTVAFAAGWYEFEIASDDGTLVTLDGATVINDYVLQPMPSRPYIKRMLVTGGLHTIDIKYYEHTGYAGLLFRFYPIDPPTTPILEIGEPVAPLLNNRLTPSFGVHTDTAGTLALSGGCTTTAPVSIGVGTSTITMVVLPDGTYGSCVATITDPDTGYSSSVAIPSFTVTPPIPQHITTCEELRDIAATSTNYAEDYVLDNDIDCLGVTVAPLTRGDAYIGTFDGGGHQITNLTINDHGGPFTGLFGQASGATIRDLTLGADGSVTGPFYVGGVVGYAENLTLQNVTSYLSVTANPGGSGIGAGGLVGEVYFTNGATTTWSGLNMYGTISGRGGEGGIVGHATISDGSTLIMHSTQISGTVQGRAPFSASAIGGLMGSLTLSGPATASLSDIGAAVTVNLRTGSTGGGLIGQILASGAGATHLTIDNASSTGSVTGRNTLGGFVGTVMAGSSGYPVDVQITNSSAAVDVAGSAGTDVGGFVGKMSLTSSSDVRTAVTFDHDSASGVVQGGVDVGGFFGGMSSRGVYMDSSGGTGGFFIYNSTASGNVTGSYGAGSSPRAGGFAGFLSCQSQNPAQFPACTLRQNSATGAVSGYRYVGGFVGQAEGDVDIEDSYTTSDVTGATDVGGFMGNLNSAYAYTNVSRVYASSTVTTSGGSPSNIGGLIGSAQTGNANTNVDHAFAAVSLNDPSGVVTNMAWMIGSLSGFTPAHLAYRPVSATTASCVGDQSGSAYCTANTSARAFLQTADDPLSDWNFTNVWRETGVTYPTLRAGTIVTYPSGASYELSSVNTTDNAATLTWSTDEHASTDVYYGVGSPATAVGRSDHPIRVTSHTAGISGLLVCTTYTFVLTSVDAYGIASTSTQQTFRTGGCGGGALSAGGGGSIPVFVPWPNTVASIVPPPPAPVITPPPSSGTVNSGSMPMEQPTSSRMCQEMVFTADLVLGATSPDVKRLQGFLNGRGNLVARSGPGSSGQETSYYGPGTTRALAAFQSANNLPADGALRVSTRDRIRSLTTSNACTIRATFSRELRLGMRGADVRALQRFLNTNGFALATDPIEARTYETGYFGPATQAALKAFQQAHQLPQTGKTDAVTRAKLNG